MEPSTESRAELLPNNEHVIDTDARGEELGETEAATRSALGREDQRSTQPVGRLKNIVEAGVDGVVGTFAVIASLSGLRLQPSTILLVGFANLIAGALSTAISHFLSSRVKSRCARLEKEEEEWRFWNLPDSQEREMCTAFVDEGMSAEDAKQHVACLMRYPALFVHVKIALTSSAPHPSDTGPAWKSAVTVFLSFVCIGAAPILGYAGLGLVGVRDSSAKFYTSCGLTALTLFVLGMYKAHSARQHKFASGMVTAGYGMIGAAAAYLAGSLLDML